MWLKKLFPPPAEPQRSDDVPSAKADRLPAIQPAEVAIPVSESDERQVVVPAKMISRGETAAGADIDAEDYVHLEPLEDEWGTPPAPKVEKPETGPGECLPGRRRRGRGRPLRHIRSFGTGPPGRCLRLALC